MFSRTTSLVSFLLLSTLLCHAKSSEVVFLEHSIRWTNENNFPYHLKLPNVRAVIFTALEQRLKEKFQFETVGIPTNIEYRVINGFGKPKINWPKSSGNGSHEVAILSSITRATSNMSMFWSMTISVRYAGKIIYTKEVNHELLPYTNSFYMNRQRWMEQDEFIDFFILLLDEALELKPPQPLALAVNSKESGMRKAADLIPSSEEYSLYMADSIMGENRHRIYQLRQGEQTLQTYVYRINDYVESVYRETFGEAILTSLVNRLLNGGNQLQRLPIPGTYSIVWNTLESSSGKKQIIRESRGNDQVDGNGKPTSPVYLYEIADMLQAHEGRISFAYFQVRNTNNEELSSRNYRPSGTYGTLGVTTTHILRGKNGNNDFELLYPEQDGMLLITDNEKPVLAMPMENQNIKSRHFFNLELAEKNKAVFDSQPETGIRAANVQRYSLLAAKELDQEAVMNNVRLIILMVHSIQWPPLSPQSNGASEY
jgi:hypothetical protein